MKGSTAPIRKVGKGFKPWQVDFRYIGGKREFFETKAEAQTVREQKLLEFRNHGTAAIALTTEERGEFIRAKERLTALGVTLAHVLDFFEKHHRAFTPTPLETAIDELYRLKLASNKRERSALGFYYTVSAFQRSLGAGKLVSEVSRQDVEQWLFKSDWAPYTVRSKLIDLQTFFRSAKERGWATHVPTDGIEKIELDDEAPGILSVEQCERLMRSAQVVHPEFCGFLSLALFCGIRPEEVAGMKPANVDLEHSFAEVPAEIAKTRQRRIVELSENAKAWVKVGLLLPPKGARNKLNAIRKHAGFQGFSRKMIDGKETWVKTEGDEWPHDCLRHSFASYHLSMYGSADKTATQMGHRSTDMLFRHYRELVRRTDAERFWKILPL